MVAGPFPAGLAGVVVSVGHVCGWSISPMHLTGRTQIVRSPYLCNYQHPRVFLVVNWIGFFVPAIAALMISGM